MKVVIWQDSLKEYRWRIVSRNGRIVAESGEGYKRRKSALNMLKKIFLNISTAVKIEDEIFRLEDEE